MTGIARPATLPEWIQVEDGDYFDENGELVVQVSHNGTQITFYHENRFMTLALLEDFRLYRRVTGEVDNGRT